MLRPYQAEAVEEVLDHLDERPCLVLPTGAGKTYTACEIIRRLGQPALWFAHRRELVGQAVDSLRAHEITPSMIMAGALPTVNPDAYVASVQTFDRRDHRPDVGLVVVDEAHHVVAGQWERVSSYYTERGIPVLGLTATPFRLDGRGLGSIFGRIIVGATPRQLCDDGTLIEPTVYAPPMRDDDDRRRKLVGDIVATWQQRAAGRPTLCFGWDVAHSKSIAAAFRAAGVRAEHVDADTPEGARAGAIYRVKTGYTTVLCNCQLFTEGFDLPAIECVIVARSTESLCLHLQMIGRGTRQSPGKADFVVLDHAGNHLRHGSMTQDLEYSLEDSADGAGVTQVAPNPGKRCPECYLLVNPSAGQCSCGFEFDSARREPRHEEGELVKFTAAEKRAAVPVESQQETWNRLERDRFNAGHAPAWTFTAFKAVYGFNPIIAGGRVIDPESATRDEKYSVYMRFVTTARERKYKPRWAGHRFEAIFGHWPDFSTASHGAARDSGG